MSCQKSTESVWYFLSKHIKFWEPLLLMAFLVYYYLKHFFPRITIKSNHIFLQKLVKIYEDNIGSILNRGQSYLVLNVESEIQILISFFIGLVYTNCKCKYKCTSHAHLICKIAIAVQQSRPSLMSCFS